MLKINNLSKSFNKETDHEIQLFKNFNLEIQKNKCTAIIGSNGCGKSTLLNMIAGSIILDDGEIMLEDKNIGRLTEEKRSVHIGRVYQNPSMGVSPSLTILENMSLADKKSERFTLKRLVKKNRIPEYIKLLKELDLGLENQLNTQVKYLSGGQRQSLSLVMATMKLPDLLLLDEHTAALDPKTSFVVMEKTKEVIERHNITTIMISHNMKDAIDYSDRIVMLDKGKVILDKDSKDITEAELMEIYRMRISRDIAS
ncbi:ABC transporter ATP-binding protein [Tissierella creatinophila]|uniref:Bicarbonate transport ATP-binding protein CmpC n=1 Tax=Tissierella creatinophila DSM 6911 TaxID=1123403 RepID=A0A1U7M799_TISCR|nr:ATP-binding cassette domain-containing protein [Tissierella creatinophila]OLS03089.1 bicarbonate transport ATP-binding protein CmpC [Tissierella creatinophila DSM 6911]